MRYADQDMYYNHEAQEDSSMNSSRVSAGIDDYLDEALVDDYGSTQDDESDSGDEQNASRLSLGVSVYYLNTYYYLLSTFLYYFCNPQSKGTTASNSFSFRKNPAASTCSPIDEHHEILDIQTPLPVSAAQPVKSELSVNQDNDNLVTLVHTVSFYRRQQSANVSLHLRKDLNIVSYLSVSTELQLHASSKDMSWAAGNALGSRWRLPC